MLLLELYFLLDVMMILATITLTFSLNNVILLINFLSMITIVGIELSVSNIEITLLILVIYESSLLCLFLVNGILLMSSLSFNYRIFVLALEFIVSIVLLGFRYLASSIPLILKRRFFMFFIFEWN